MLNQVSWTTYTEIVIFLAAIYYIFVLFRYYRTDALQMLKARQADAGTPRVPEVLRYEQPQEVIHYPDTDTPNEDMLDKLQNKDFAASELFIGQLKECIQQASGKPFAPETLIPKIKILFRDHPELIHSPQRPFINELIVQECESTGTALLTENEVDHWWTD